MNRVVIPLFLSIFLLIVGSPLDLSAQSETSRLFKIQAPKDGPAERIYFHSVSGDIEALLTFRKHLINQGARKVNCFVPFVVVCELPYDISYQEFLTNTDIVPLRETDIEAVSTQNYVYGPKWAKHCYKISAMMSTNENWEAQELEALNHFVMPEMNIPHRPAKPIAISSPAESRNKLLHQNSEFMIGDILSQAVYTESIGPEENWSDSQLSQAASATVLAMIYYQETFPHIPIDFIFRSVPRALTALEPIKFDIPNGAVWIADVMNHLGYHGDQSEYLDLVHQFNNEWRIQWGTDWVFTAFIVNSTNDDNNRFGTRPAKELYLSFSNLGGPYMAIPFPAGWPGISPIKQLFIHELGRIFWATYEQLGRNDADCDTRSGYLNYINWNQIVEYGDYGGVEGCSPTYHPVACIMNLAWAYYGYDGPPCPFSTGMMGLVDENDNRVPDALDAPPDIIFENTVLESTIADSFHLRFQAVSQAVPNKNPYQKLSQRINYALPIKDVSYLVNGVGPIRIYPDDNVYDEKTEDFEALISTLIPGTSEIEVISRNSLGATSEGFIKHVYYIGLHYIHFSFIYLNNGIGISWNMLGETFDANFDLHRIESGPVPRDSIVASDIQPSSPSTGYFTPFYAFDGSVIPGHKYRYYVEGTFTFNYRGQDTTITHISNEFEVTASLHIEKQNILSAPSPNPFRDQTWISIRVPTSTREADNQSPDKSGLPGNAARAPALQDDVPTDVNIKIYNALGQRVKNLHSGWSYSTVLTLGWDGTNDNNVRVPSGVYFLRAKAGPYTQVQKVLLIR
jgi:hypothetical protein